MYNVELRHLKNYLNKNKREINLDTDKRWVYFYLDYKFIIFSWVTCLFLTLKSLFR